VPLHVTPVHDAEHGSVLTVHPDRLGQVATVTAFFKAIRPEVCAQVLPRRVPDEATKVLVQEPG
jgi:hypothetical protein